MTWPVADGVLELGDLEVERGGVIRDARLAWQSHGTLNAARDNLVLYPCSFSARHQDLSWLIGPDGVLDPTRWFVVIPDMFSNGLSSSASQLDDYPDVVTPADNVRAQHGWSLSTSASRCSRRRTASPWGRSRPTTGPRSTRTGRVPASV